jgi:hypothetical protein
MKKPLRIVVLERVERFRPGEFPIEFNLASPLTDITSDPGELLHEMDRLAQAGLLDVRMQPRIQGKLHGGALLGITLQGKKELEDWREKQQSKSLVRKVPLALWGILLFISGGIANEFIKPIGSYLAHIFQQRFHLP